MRAQMPTDLNCDYIDIGELNLLGHFFTAKSLFVIWNIFMHETFWAIRILFFLYAYIVERIKKNKESR